VIAQPHKLAKLAGRDVTGGVDVERHPDGLDQVFRHIVGGQAEVHAHEAHELAEAQLSRRVRVHHLEQLDPGACGGVLVELAETRVAMLGETPHVVLARTGRATEQLLERRLR